MCKWNETGIVMLKSCCKSNVVTAQKLKAHEALKKGQYDRTE
jgi:hypothetical protein